MSPWTGPLAALADRIAAFQDSALAGSPSEPFERLALDLHATQAQEQVAALNRSLGAQQVVGQRQRQPQRLAFLGRSVDPWPRTLARKVLQLDLQTVLLRLCRAGMGVEGWSSKQHYTE